MLVLPLAMVPLITTCCPALAAMVTVRFVLEAERFMLPNVVVPGSETVIVLYAVQDVGHPAGEGEVRSSAEVDTRPKIDGVADRQRASSRERQGIQRQPARPKAASLPTTTVPCRDRRCR